MILGGSELNSSECSLQSYEDLQLYNQQASYLRKVSTAVADLYGAGFSVELFITKCPPEQKWNDAAQKCLKHVVS